MESLNHLVIQEKYYHSIYGYFTKVVSRVGFLAPHHVSHEYEIRVLQADQTQLLVSAFSEKNGKTENMVSIDQSFRVDANFPLPKPRAEFLRLQARRHLQNLLTRPRGQVGQEEGIFTGYFRYEVREDSRKRPVAYAIGIKSPVLGVQLDSGSQDDEGPQTLVSDSDSNSNSGEGMTGIPLKLSPKLTSMSLADASRSPASEGDRLRYPHLSSSQGSTASLGAASRSRSGNSLVIEFIPPNER